MKKNLLLIISLLLSSVVFGQQIGVYPTGATGCIARWTFDEANNIVDSSGHNNNGIWNYATSTAGWRNVPGQAVKLNGYTTYGTVQSSSSLKPDYMTIVALVKMDAYNQSFCQNSEIMVKGQDWTDGCYLMRINDNAYEDNCNTFYPNHQNMDANFNAEVAGYDTAQPIIELGKWYFLAATFDGTTKHMYHVEMDPANFNPPTLPYHTKTAIAPLGTNNSSIYFGWNPYYTMYRYNGAFDEIVLFDRALDQKELISVYTYLWNKGLNTTKIKNVVEDKLTYSVVDKVITLQYASGIDNEVEVFDMQGRKILGKKFASSTSLDVSTFASQILLVKIRNHEGNFVFKTFVM